MPYIEVIPAYGRDYKNQKDAQADWKDNKDFQISEAGSDPQARFGQYVTRAEAVAAGLSVIIRYGNRQKVMQAK